MHTLARNAVMSATPWYQNDLYAPVTMATCTFVSSLCFKEKEGQNLYNYITIINIL